MVGPDFVIELDTRTVMNGGTLVGGPELLPGLLIQAPPQVGGFGLVEPAKPLKPAGAAPPLSVLKFAHCALQNVTRLPITAFPSPITKLP
jgi:hypothetical protein